MQIDVFYSRMICTGDQWRFTVLCTPADSSDKTQLMCSTILLCLFVSYSDSSATSLNYSTLSNNKTSFFLNHLQGYSKACLVLLREHLLKTRLGMCIYKTSFPHRPDNYFGLTSSCPPTFYHKIVPVVVIK